MLENLKLLNVRSSVSGFELRTLTDITCMRNKDSFMTYNKTKF